MTRQRILDAWEVLRGRKVAVEATSQLLANPDFEVGGTEWYTSGTTTGNTFGGGFWYGNPNTR